MGETHPVRLHPEWKKIRDRGENRWNAKMTEKGVLAMRAEYANGNKSFRELSEKYGISPGMVHRIIRRKYWTHI
jgi:DNA-binding MarR family transcriptional regulator